MLIGLSLAASAVYLGGLGAGTIDDPSFCPGAPMTECLEFSVEGIGLYFPVAFVFWLGLLTPQFLRRANA